MATKEMVSDLIKLHWTEDSYIGGISKEKINEIEAVLGVKLPEDYRWFLGTYGHGGDKGIEIFGGSKGPVAHVVKETLEFRDYGKIPTYLLVIESFGDGHANYCLDTREREDGKNPVIFWGENEGFIREKSLTFIEYLYNNIIESAENWDNA